MILEIDMGNSRIKWRCRGESGNLARGVVSDSYQHLAAEWTALPIRRVWVASVRGEAHNEAFRQWCRTNLQLEAEFARSARHAAGVTNSYANPGLMGVDRWLAMLAAFAHTGDSCVVVQAGSALTADLLSASGEHLGGYIGPGLTMKIGRASWRETVYVLEHERWLSMKAQVLVVDVEYILILRDTTEE